MSRRPNFEAEDEALKLLKARTDESRYLRDWDLVQDINLDEEAEDEHRLAALTLVDSLRRQADYYEQSLLEALRDREDPVSWPRIGTALGVTRQGAERRYLRATAPGVRDANRARTGLRHQREREEISRATATARWGRADKASRDWHLTVRVRTRTQKETTVQLKGSEGTLPELRRMVSIGEGFEYLDRLQVLEVIEEVTPWPNVEPSASLAGLDNDQE